MMMIIILREAKVWTTLGFSLNPLQTLNKKTMENKENK
jgi:hypothetical protein